MPDPFPPNLCGPKTIPLAVGSMTIGGPTHTLVVNGKAWRFELHRFCGVLFCKKNGDELRNTPGPSHPFWKAFQLWEAQGHGFNADGTCRFDPDLEVLPITRHLGGKHYEIVGHETVGERRARLANGPGVTPWA